MEQSLSITAMVTAAPAGLRHPQLQAGETLAQFVIRNHRHEWQNLMEWLEHHFNVPKSVCKELHKPEKLTRVTDQAVRAEIMKFVNSRLPVHSRTLHNLSELRRYLNEIASGARQALDLVQILFPRERAPDGDTSFVKEAEALGAEVFFVETGLREDIDFADHLPRIKGDLLWTLAGVTTFSPPLTALMLLRVVKFFIQTPELALYQDGAYSTIYRTSALWELAESGQTLGHDTRQHARMLQEAGYQLALDRGEEFALSELESLYGGNQSSSAGPKAGFWSKLFGRSTNAI